VTSPAPFIPESFPLQVFRIGCLFIVGVPAELSTMSGRRLQSTVRDAVMPSLSNGEEPIILIAGLANGYAHHVTTYEEYKCQKFEGASTLFGPHTLAGLQQEFFKLSKALATGRTDLIAPGPRPKDVSKYRFHTIPDVILDTAPISARFGTIVEQADDFYRIGSIVTVRFWGANPRNDLKLGDSYLSVEHQNPDTGEWTTIATDANWETKIWWKRSGVSRSIVTIEWEIPLNTIFGFYRIAYHGTSRKINGALEDFTGFTKDFSVGVSNGFSGYSTCTIM